MFSANASQVSGDKLYADDVFSIVPYGGSGSAVDINAGIDLATHGGMVWIKRRDAVYDHAIQDTIRSLTQAIHSNLTDASVNRGVVQAGSQSATGFTLGATAYGNTSGGSYVAMTFRRAKKFFDVVTWTGNGSDPQTVSHSLGTAPGLVVAKKTSATGDWIVYAPGYGATTFHKLNGVDAGATSTLFSSFTSSVIQPRLSMNDSGATYVAYLFADDASTDGLIRCGSFTTDGSGAATVSLGWEPQFLLAKISSATGGWLMLDTLRGWKNGASESLLFANTSDAESSSGSGNPTADGFAFSGSALSTYIYMAIRRPNKPPTDATKVFNLQTATGNGGGSIAGASVLPNANKSAARNVDLAILGVRGGSSKNLQFYDRVRGFQNAVWNSPASDTLTSPRLTTSATAAEVTSGNAVFQGSGASGYEDYVRFQTADTSLVAYALKRAPGFFDMVKFTGQTSAHWTSHNLGVKPELIIRKRLDSATFGDWDVAPGYPASWGLACKLNAANAYANTGALGSGADPHTTTQFTSTESSTGQHIAYLFASCPGVSKVGHFTGDGTTRTINCGFTTGARFVLIKKTSASSDWRLFDTARGITGNATDPYLGTNLTTAEQTTSDGLDAHTSGFIVFGDCNTSGADYLYLAIA